MAMDYSEGGMIWLQTLIELKLFNSRFSSSNFSIRVFRAYPLIDIRQTVPCRAIRGRSSDSRQQYLSQQYPPSLPEFEWRGCPTELGGVPQGICSCGRAALSHEDPL